MEKTTREQFEEIVYSTIKREGIKQLMEYISASDFFIAPASKNQHSAYEGGLAEHSINVYQRLRNLVEMEYGGFDVFSEESVAICGLFHDVCKIDFYKIEQRNVKEGNNWVKKPHYVIEEKLPYGHGEKSVYIINGFLRLTREEALAINWHMGGFDQRVQGGNFSIGEAYRIDSLALLLHLADMLATYIDENHLQKKEDKKDE